MYHIIVNAVLPDDVIGKPFKVEDEQVGVIKTKENIQGGRTFLQVEIDDIETFIKRGKDWFGANIDNFSIGYSS